MLCKTLVRMLMVLFPLNEALLNSTHIYAEETFDQQYDNNNSYSTQTLLIKFKMG